MTLPLAPYRRDILKALTAVGLGGASLPFGVRKLAFAADTAAPVLIVVHLRGGCDGLNLISPANDPTFISARASDLRVQDSGPDAGFALDGKSLDPAIDFRLHQNAGGLFDIYRSGALAFVHACGLTDATRSHFVATDMIEAGVGAEKDLAHSDTGWLTRAIANQTLSSSGLAAVSVSNAMGGELRGLNRALAAPDINNGLPAIGGASTAAALWQMYGKRSDALGEAGRLALQLPVIIDQHLGRDDQGRVIAYGPENNANYDQAGGFANTLKSVARLIKMNLGLSAITLDYGSWDTHEHQAGRFRAQVEPLSAGLSAFWTDIAAYHDRVVLVTLTEFGRRLRSNKSNGTDHGRAGIMAVMGGKVQGGKLYGKWPGLDTQHLDESVDLSVTTDYRQVLAEVMAQSLGPKSTAVFPAFRPGPSLGLFA